MTVTMRSKEARVIYAKWLGQRDPVMFRALCDTRAVFGPALELAYDGPGEPELRALLECLAPPSD
jgi:hypothetical protein